MGCHHNVTWCQEWDDPGLLVVMGSISCQLKNLSGKVLHNSSQVYWGTSSYSSAEGTLQAYLKQGLSTVLLQLPVTFPNFVCSTSEKFSDSLVKSSSHPVFFTLIKEWTFQIANRLSCFCVKTSTVKNLQVKHKVQNPRK